MIQFDPPYKGTDKSTNFPIIVLAYVGGGDILVIKDDGDMDRIQVTNVNVDWRWDPQRRTFVSIDDASED